MESHNPVKNAGRTGHCLREIVIFAKLCRQLYELHSFFSRMFAFSGRLYS